MKTSNNKSENQDSVTNTKRYALFCSIFSVVYNIFIYIALVALLMLFMHIMITFSSGIHYADPEAFGEKIKWIGILLLGSSAIASLSKSMAEIYQSFQSKK